jgi:hypothetical protein|uniref:peptidylprolyl isomerase n=1 Tax=Ostreococcus mediterraneus TaxID=1486918 RepID=A0A7S0PKR8_9CHLO|mmetsp:Transcript_23/g.93  ORF Transcript_23/g.93 Transcript_23/m.93 type:complete len:238 (+) Transcript_23:32-745(+)
MRATTTVRATCGATARRGQTTTTVRSSSASSAASASRRQWLASAASVLAMHKMFPSSNAFAEDAGASVRVVSDAPGFGAREARARDLVLVSLVGTFEDGTSTTPTTFDTTLGGLVYDTNASGTGSVSITPAEAMPKVISLDKNNPVPGVPPGLIEGIIGMRVGGERTFEVPSAVGFGDSAVKSPYALIPGGTTLKYSVKLIRLSSTGPDALFKGVYNCSLGGANKMTSGCGAVEPSE